MCYGEGSLTLKYFQVLTFEQGSDFYLTAFLFDL